MERFFTKTFFKFFFGFVAIISVAFGVMIAASSFSTESNTPTTTASPSDY